MLTQRLQAESNSEGAKLTTNHIHLWPGRGGAACVLYLKIENRNSAGIPEGNHKTIRAARGCSGRADSQNPGPNCALHPGTPDKSSIDRRTQIPARKARDENRGQEGRRMFAKRRKGSGTVRYAAVGAHRAGTPALVATARAQFRALGSLPVPHSPRSPHHAQI